MSDARLADILTFSDARRLVDANVVPREPGAKATLPDGFENARYFRVLIDWSPGYEFDAPVVLVEKATAHVRREPWNAIFSSEIRAMKPVTG